MSLSQHVRLARVLALAVPALLLGGAYLSQYGFGLYPCEMCWWQRWPHFAALALAVISFFPRRNPARWPVLLAAVAILLSGLIGGFHAGVEYGWWEGITSCTTTVAAGEGSYLDAIMNAPIVRCDQVQWSLIGISLAGYNFLISVASAIAIFLLAAKGPSR